MGFSSRQRHQYVSMSLSLLRSEDTSLNSTWIVLVGVDLIAAEQILKALLITPSVFIQCVFSTQSIRHLLLSSFQPYKSTSMIVYLLQSFPTNAIIHFITSLHVDSTISRCSFHELFWFNHIHKYLKHSTVSISWPYNFKLCLSIPLFLVNNTWHDSLGEILKPQLYDHCSTFPFAFLIWLITPVRSRPLTQMSHHLHTMLTRLFCPNS